MKLFWSFVFHVIIPLSCIFSVSSTETTASESQMRNIVEALIGTDDFGSWANVLYGVDPSSLPISATLFVPSDEALSRLTFTTIFDPSIIQYHIVPRQFSFFDLRQFKIGDRIPTLLRNATILVTNDTSSNFSLNDCLITHPDIYINGVIAVHGVASVLNHTLYNAVTEDAAVRPFPHPRPPAGGQSRSSRSPGKASDCNSSMPVPSGGPSVSRSAAADGNSSMPVPSGGPSVSGSAATALCIGLLTAAFLVGCV